MRFFHSIAPQCAPRSSLPQRAVSQLASAKTVSESLPEGFSFFSNFLDNREQRILLSAALSQLDTTENTRVRRSQRQYRAGNPVSNNSTLEDVFLPDNYYTFHKGHYDNVIRNYREMHLSSWAVSGVHGLAPVLDRLCALYPSRNTQIHLLHLASDGEILPHIDNVSASGGWILGVSLGATRTLRMESPGLESLDIMLPSGSVYLQRDQIRYHWMHSILPSTDRKQAKCAQRVSVMIRDRKDAWTHRHDLLSEM